MIVLDTNQLERHSLNSPYMAILKVVSRLTGNKLALSEVTYNEHCAHFENQLRRALVQEGKAGAELMRLRIAAGHHKTARATSNAQTSRLADRWRTDYQTRLLEVFDLIALDGKSAIEALRREAWRIPPASTSFDVKGTGARDAAIWLSLVRESIERSERIFFISDDKRAFKAPELARDLAKTSEAVTVLEDIGELLKILADDVDVTIDVALIAESDSLSERVIQYLGSTSIPGDAVSIAMEFSRPNAGCSYSGHKFTRIEYLGARDIRGHVIGNETWVTGVVRWSVTYSLGVEWFRPGESIRHYPDELWDVTFQTSSVVIFSRSSNEIDGVEVLSAGKPATVSRIVTTLR